ncbi:hypothetical protein ACOME3_005097 [Neoechinorhynchus agilis]
MFFIFSWDLLALLKIVVMQLDSLPKLKLSFNDEDIPYNQLLPIENASTRPVVVSTFESNKLYTLIMLDPDGPSPKNRELSPYLHWLDVNTGSSDLFKEVNVYVPPAPPAGIHRYVTLVFEQKGYIDGSKLYFPKRNNFPFRSFVEENGLTLKYGHVFRVDSKKPA